MPLLHGLDNGKELTVVRIVVLLCWRTLPQLKIEWSEGAKAIILVQDPCDGEATCIGLQDDRLSLG